MNLDPTAVKQQIANLRLQFPELEEDEADWLVSLESETNTTELLSKIVDRLDDVAALAGGLEGKIAEFHIRADRYRAQQLKLRAVALAVMQMAGVKKMELPSATLSVRAGSTRVEISDEASVPDVLCKITRTPDKTRIKELLTNGDPASVNWAALVQQPDTLAIRTK